MFSEMDTDAFLAFVKAHQRVLQQQAEIDALGRRGVLRKQGKTHAPRWRHVLLHILRHCRRAVSLGFHTFGKGGSLSQGHGPAGASRKRPEQSEVEACRAVE